MNRAIRDALGVLGCAALIGLCVLLVIISRAVVSAEGVEAAATKAVLGMDSLRTNLQVQLLGDPVGKKNRRRGLIEELTDASREGRKTIDVVQATSLAERKKVAEFSDASIQAVNDLDAVERNAATTVLAIQGAVGELNGTLTALKDDGMKVQGTIDGATALLGTLDRGTGQALGDVNTALDHIDELVVASRPTVDHVDLMTGHLNDGSKALAETLGFIRDDFSPKKKSFWMNLLDKATNGAVSALVSILLPEHVKIDK